MKKLIITITMALFASWVVNAQTKYETGMQEAFDLASEKKTDEAVAMFERIGQAEKENWIPTFHAAHTLIIKSYEIHDEEKRLNILEKAKTFLRETYKRSKDNPEVLSLEAKLLTSYMAFDPATYGMMYAMKIEGIHQRAYAMAPDNLRVLVGKIQYDHGKSQFFGEDTSNYCEEMKQLIPTLKAEKVTEPFAPSHGLVEAEGFITRCK